MKEMCLVLFIGLSTFFFAFLIKRFLGVVVHPLFDLKMKQIEWRKEKWQNAQKEESIGITLIR